MERLTELLLATQNPDPSVRTPAEQQLLEFERTRFADYLGALVAEFGTDGKPVHAREAAALQIKRILTGQDEQSSRQKQAQWDAINADAQAHVKQVALRVLGTAPVAVSKQAAQVVETLAKLELPGDRWPDLPASLVHTFDAVLQRSRDDIIGPLLALGYFAGVAAEVGHGIDEGAIDSLLSKISIGMASKSPREVQIAATDALADTLDFARHNMEKEQERGAIMRLILDMTRSPYPEAREHAFRCLSTVLELYYTALPASMEEVWKTTYEAIQNVNEDQVAKQALNFWSEMAQEEVEREREAERLATQQPPQQLAAEQRSFGFMRKVQQPLSQLVLEFCLLQQDEMPDDDEKTDDTLYGAAEHCFANMCACLGVALLPFTLRFVQNNIVHADWRRRQAALFALGAVLREAPSEQVEQAVKEVLHLLLRRMLSGAMPKLSPYEGAADITSVPPEPVATVRETAAWAVAAVCVKHLKMLPPPALHNLLLSLLDGLKDKPRVAHMAAAAIHAFAAAVEPLAGRETHMLSGDPMRMLAEALWNAARRDDSDQWQLMEDAFEALIQLVQSAALDSLQLVGIVLLPAALKRLVEIRSGAVRDANGFQEVELCQLVAVCVIRLDKKILSGTSGFELADEVVKVMIAVLQRPHSLAHADAFAGLAEVTRVTEDGFLRYKDAVMPLVFNGLQSRQNAQVCIAAARLCSDVFSALNGRPEARAMLPQALQLVHANLRAEDLHRDVKPPHLTALGDICDCVGAAGLGDEFGTAVGTCLAAASIAVDVTEPELADYLNAVREAALEALELMMADASPQQLRSFLPGIFNVSRAVARETADPRNYYENKDPSLVPADLGDMQPALFPYQVSLAVQKATLGVLGDALDKAGDELRNPVKNSASDFLPLVESAQMSGNEDLREAAQYMRRKAQI